MGGTCGTYKDKANAHRFLVVKLERKSHLEDRGIDGSVILKLSCRNRMGGF
jgi:hypothetical protein